MVNSCNWLPKQRELDVRPTLLKEIKSDAEIIEGLSNGGVESSHSYIRLLNVDYDRQQHHRQLARDIAPGDDYRYTFGDGKDERWVMLERLPWDSRFFGRGIARLNNIVRPGAQASLRADITLDATAVSAALANARNDGISYIFSVVDAVDLPSIRALCVSGFELIETRCHYHMPLKHAPEHRHATRLATPEDVPSLARTAREMVNRFDRFHADPEIQPEDADRLMEEWVRASIMDGFADATVVPDVDEPEAFCTAKYHKQHWSGWGLKLSQPVLSAVSPKHKGWYVRIISELNEHLRQIGAEHSFLVTQATNNAVIRCWEKIGYQYGKSEHVFRKVI